MIRQFIALVTLAAFLFSPLRVLSAEQVEHIVPAMELRLQLTGAEQQRQNDLGDVDRFLAREDAQQLLARAGVDPLLVRDAIPQLDSETLAELADQSRQVEQEVSGGFVGGIIILLVLALVLAVVLIKNTDFFD